MTVKRPVSGSLAWAFFSIIALSVLTSTVALLTLASSQRDAEAINIAGSLRMPLYVFTSPVPPELDAEVLPTTYIFDKAGRVVFGHTGMAQWDAPEIVAYLEALSGEKTD